METSASMWSSEELITGTSRLVGRASMAATLDARRDTNYRRK